MTPAWTLCDRAECLPDVAPPLQQHPIYGAACAGLGSAALWYRLPGAGGGTRATAQVLVRHWPLLGSAVLLSRGPVWATGTPDAARLAGLRALLDQLRGGFRVVAVTPDTCSGADPLAGAGWLATMSPATLARLDLSAEPDVLRARQSAKWRNRLVKAESAGLAVRNAPMPARPGHWLLGAEAAQARARGYRRLPSVFTLAWCRAGGRRASRLFVAERGGQPVAAMLFLLHGAGASYHIGWSGPEGRATCAHNLLLWQAMLWLRAQGVTALDLDTVDTETAPGLARFKLGAGAQAVRLGATRIAAPLSGLFATRAEKAPAPLPSQAASPER